MNGRRFGVLPACIGVWLSMTPAAAEGVPAESPPPSPGGLACEYSINRLGIDEAFFRWEVAASRKGLQSAYRILVASSEERLAVDVGDLWDSGEVPSGRSSSVTYRGRPLRPGGRYWWKVKVWGEHGTTSPFSRPGVIDTGLGERAARRPAGDCDALRYRDGRLGRALDLDGTGDTAEIESYDGLKPSGEITISAWIRPRETSDRWAEIYRKEDGEARQLLSIGKTGFYGLWLGLGVGGRYREHGAPLDRSRLADGEWHHVAASYDGSSARFYLDGSELRRVAMSGRIDTAGTSPAFIGSSGDGSEFFPGSIDDLRIYDRALGESQVRSLAAGREEVLNSRLVGWWKLDGDLHNSARPGGARTRRPDVELEENRYRILLLGNGLIEHAARHGYIETALTCRWPERQITFRNLGLSGDNVFGEARTGFGPGEKHRSSWRRPGRRVADYGLRKLLDQVCQERPDVIIVGYGSSVAREGARSIGAFGEGLGRLLDELERQAPHIILLSPIPAEEPRVSSSSAGPPDEGLPRTVEILRQAAGERGHLFVDLHAPLQEVAAGEPSARLTDNSIHPNARGYWEVARVIEAELDLPSPGWTLHLMGDGHIEESSGTLVRELEVTPHGMWFDLIDDRLRPVPPAGAPGLRRRLRVEGLAPGRYSLSIDGKRRLIASAEEWARGVDLTSGPELEQAERLRQAIVEKNRYHVYRLRPQNEAYIFLFRRHERGHHAGEMSQFGLLVEKKEREIARLRVPAIHRYEVVRERTYPDHEVPRFIPEPDTAAELLAFRVADGFEVNLFASEPMIANPIQATWDARGRLWVATSTTYPHLAPGEEPDDRIVILEDSDGDGRADRSTVFADGLLIPHSVELGDGGVYVTASTELLFLADRDGDDRADERRVLLSGFGNADVHHLIHALRWGPGGWLYFNQSIYINSYVETPHGRRRLRAGGIWQLRPEDLRLDVYSRGLVNPWGHAFDRWGQSFATDGAGGGGIAYVFPGARYQAAEGPGRTLETLNPGHPKACGLEVLSGRHLPPSWRGTLITSDFRANRIRRYRLEEEGSGYASIPLDDLLSSSHRSFRPVDLKMGPDGAIYIVDWYNPIIDHGEVDFHHPARDSSHGRIWRVTAKGRPLVKPPKLASASVAELLEALRLPEEWTRHRARRQLVERGAAAVAAALRRWVSGLDPQSEGYEHDRLEALWVFQSLDVVEPDLLRDVLRSPEARSRAAAVRVLSCWQERISGAQEMLTRGVSDEHPRVRLEAVHAWRRNPSPLAANRALRVLESPMDEFIDHAAWLTARELRRFWLAELQSGRPVFGGDADRLRFALESVDEPAVLRPLVDLVRRGGLADASRDRVLGQIASLGGEDELELVLDLALSEKEPGRQAALLSSLESRARRGGPVPEQAGRVAELLTAEEPSVLVAAAGLCGLWKVHAARRDLVFLAGDAARDGRSRLAAARGLARLGDEESLERLAELSAPALPPGVRATSLAARASVDPGGAAAPAVDLLAGSPPEADARLVFEAFVGRQGGGQALATALKSRQLPPKIAASGIAVAGSSGRDLAALIEALTRAGSLAPTSGEITAGEITPGERGLLLQQVRRLGDPARGERVYRRAVLSCMNCHAIGGAGGKVGPALDSIGATAPVDYLLESLLKPSARLKEGYRTVTVIRQDGTITSGILQRKGSEVLVRDGSDQLHTVPSGEIADMSTTEVSLMPDGLTASLRRDELIDLVRFLSELGRTESYRVPARRWVRRWRVLTSPGGLNDHRSLSTGPVAHGTTAGTPWKPAYSTTRGELLLEDLPWLDRNGLGGNAGEQIALASFEIEVTTAGRVGLRFESTAGLAARIDSTPINLESEVTIELAEGIHVVALRVDRARRRAPLRVELFDVPDSRARGRIVDGK